jgi:hypothetical protein
LQINRDCKKRACLCVTDREFKEGRGNRRKEIAACRESLKLEDQAKEQKQQKHTYRY